MKRFEEDDVRVGLVQPVPLGARLEDDPVEAAYEVVRATRVQKQKTNQLRWGLGLKAKDALPAIELIQLFGSEIAKDAAERRVIERKARQRSAGLLAALLRMLALHRADLQMARLKTDPFGKSSRRPDCRCGPCVQAREAVAAELGCRPEDVMARIDVDGRLVAAVTGVRRTPAEDAA